MFSSESTFSQPSDSLRIALWRNPGLRYNVNSSNTEVLPYTYGATLWSMYKRHCTIDIHHRCEKRYLGLGFYYRIPGRKTMLTKLVVFTPSKAILKNSISTLRQIGYQRIIHWNVVGDVKVTRIRFIELSNNGRPNVMLKSISPVLSLSGVEFIQSLAKQAAHQLHLTLLLLLLHNLFNCASP